jgi:DNA polymerase III subunit epsilon
VRQIVLDTETTGLYADQGDRIVEIGCVELDNRKLTGRHFHHYLNPERDSHEEALKVHGIANEFLKDKPKFEQVAQEFLQFIQGSELIIHNAPFDVGFLNSELERAGLPLLRHHVHQVIDTLAMAKEMYPGKRNSLDALCDRLEVDNSSRTLHGALLDAELLADVYLNMTRGQDALIMESSAHESALESHQDTALRQFDLPVLRASEQEVLLHEEVLTQIDKSSQGKTLWRVLNPLVT